jgi:hypothetical protein
LPSASSASFRPIADGISTAVCGHDAPTEIRLTRRQKRFLSALAAEPWRSFADAAREAGYAESVARKPSIIFESPIVRHAWEQWLKQMA